MSKRARNSELGKRSGARAIDGHVRTPITTETLAAFAEGTETRFHDEPWSARLLRELSFSGAPGTGPTK
ncbi:hypothetical protein [Arthrobacter sp. H35-D1]|uniref:hypothetical protein n=1 Tax=Arthrobacter sp. H35-D1 TaxID=3046202 RepID=UPI0024BBE2C8|nr:hypothetical protein [Arthrobacter sp. H35-D1]MDJ0314704.1 hypothetical protein [Arthrobacter sp. H35-D1]